MVMAMMVVAGAGAVCGRIGFACNGGMELRLQVILNINSIVHNVTK